MKIYLDVCCLSRPFDDQSQARIRLEAEAVLLIIAKALTEHWEIVDSDAVDIEVANIPDASRHQQISRIVSQIYSEHIAYTPEIIERAKFLAGLGFKRMDALHVACAETAKVDAFLTTDGQLIKIAKRNSSVIQIVVDNPTNWLAKQGGENENT